MLALLESPESWLAFATLALLETVLGIDNVIFLSILVAVCRRRSQRSARHRRAAAGDADAPGAAVLGGVADAADRAAVQRAASARFSGRDLILGAGGLFLLGKSATEIHRTLDEARCAARGMGAECLLSRS